jgi:hypothetical protein
LLARDRRWRPPWSILIRGIFPLDPSRWVRTPRASNISFVCPPGHAFLILRRETEHRSIHRKTDAKHSTIIQFQN